jgi:small-conductance mechanosensitive channel
MRKILIDIGITLATFVLLLFAWGFLELIAEEEYELITAIKDMTVTITIMGIMFATLFSRKDKK